MHHSLYCYFSHTFLQILYIGFEQTTFKFSESEWYAFQKKAEQHHTKLCFTCCKLGVVLAFNRSFKSLNKNQLEFQTPKKLMRDLGDHPQCLILIQFQNSLKVDSFFRKWWQWNKEIVTEGDGYYSFVESNFWKLLHLVSPLTFILNFWEKTN